MKYYYDETKYNNHYADFLKDKDNYKYLEPFYISNTEISNIEYKEFINWVAEYNGFSNLEPLYIGIDSVNPQAFIYTRNNFV